MRWPLVLLGFAALTLLLACLPGRTRIPPAVGSDYCYLLVAADRMFEGLGPTTPLPVAPGQPWTWQADWGFLTQWPIGYPLVVCCVRWLFGLSTIQACQSISVVACAAALVGWFVWIRRIVPHGVTGVLLAAVAAGCSVSTASLIDPSTDILLVAMLPFVLLFSRRAIGHLQSFELPTSRRRAAAWLALAGLTAGGLFWIRYASIFVPAAVGLYLLIERVRRRVVSLGQVGLFALCAAGPITILVVINRTFGMASSTQAQLNLGHGIGVDFSIEHLATAWWNFTQFGFYDYHWYSKWVFALWPPLVVLVAICHPAARRAARSFLAAPGVMLSALVVLLLLAVLIAATALFGGKYDYVGQGRYYASARPLYFLLFVAPVMLIPRRAVRAVLCVGLLVACSWIVQQEWPRPYRRWLNANREVTPYGQWAHCFEPNAADLYRWVQQQKADNLIVVSNFHDHITLETQIPALPIPPDIETLTTWIERICDSRGVSDPRVLFVLDHDNRWRDYWIKPTPEIIQAFGLKQRTPGVPVTVSAFVFDYTVAGRGLADGST